MKDNFGLYETLDGMFAGVVLPGADRFEGMPLRDTGRNPGFQRSCCQFEDLGRRLPVGLHVVDDVIDHDGDGLAAIVRDGEVEGEFSTRINCFAVDDEPLDHDVGGRLRVGSGETH